MPESQAPKLSFSHAPVGGWVDEPPPCSTSEDMKLDNLPTYLYLFIHVDVDTHKWSKSCPQQSGPSTNSGSSPLPPCPETPHVAPPTAPSHSQNGQAGARGEVIPAKTALLVHTSFAMQWEEGGRGGENLHFKHLHLL